MLRDSDSFDASNSESCSYLWRIVGDELNTYRSITSVCVRDGSSTSFWFDHWLPDGPLCSTHSALFSHTTRPNVSVQKVFQNRFELWLRPRLTSAASTQLSSLLSHLQGITLVQGADARVLKISQKPYNTRDAYAAIERRQETSDLHGRRIWSTRLPNKVKIFAWLYFKDRLSTRVNLHAKHVVDGDQCQRCSSTVEDKHHTFFCCTVSSGVWQRLGLSEVANLSDAELWNYRHPTALDKRLWPFVFLTILWRLWDARNGEIFRAEHCDSRMVLSRVCDDFIVWRKRLCRDLVNSLNDWRAYLLSCNSVTSSSQLELV